MSNKRKRYVKVSDEQIKYICDAYANQNLSVAKLSGITGISEPYIHVILNRNKVPCHNQKMSDLSKKYWENKELNELKRKELEKIDRVLKATREYMNKLDNGCEVSEEDFMLAQIVTGRNKKELVKNLLKKAIELMED